MNTGRSLPLLVLAGAIIFVFVYGNPSKNGLHEGLASPPAVEAGADSAASLPLLELPTNVHGAATAKEIRTPVLANPKHLGQGLNISFEGITSASRIPDVAVLVTSGDWQVSTVLSPGKSKYLPLPGPCEGDIQVVSNSWSETSVSFSCEKGQIKEVNLIVLPRAAIKGIVIDDSSRDAISSYTVWVETQLLPSLLGMGKSSGIPLNVTAANGRFEIIPYQQGESFRVHIEAPGYQPLYSHWLTNSSSGAIDFGQIPLQRAAQTKLAVQVLSPKGEPYLGPIAYCYSPDPLTNSDFTIAGATLSSRGASMGRISGRAQPANDDGNFHLLVPRGDGASLALLAPGHPLEVITLPPLLGHKGFCSVQLSTGSELHCVSFLSDSDQTLLKNLRLEVRGDGAWLQAPLTEAMKVAFEPLELHGLEEGRVTVLLIAQEAVAVGGRQVLVARAEAVLSSKQATYLVLDCMSGQDGGLSGRVLLPASSLSFPLRASWLESPMETLPAISAGVQDDRFEMRAPGTDAGVLVVSGSNSDGDSCAYWFSRQDQAGNAGPVTVDLASSHVRGHLGPLTPGQFEAVVISPTGESSLKDWSGVSARVYPAPDGDFAIWGLPPGQYWAVAQGTGKKVQFKVGDSSYLDVYLE